MEIIEREVPPLADDNGDGFVDGGGEYRLFHGGTAQRLTNKRGRGFSDASSGVWDATKSIVSGDGFAVLLEGSGRLAGRYLVWDVGGDGVIKKTNGWYSADEMMEEGYETTFDVISMEIIEEGCRWRMTTGMVFVDGGGEYRLFHGGTAATDKQAHVKDFLMHRVECGMQRSQLLKETVLRCCWREVVV